MNKNKFRAILAENGDNYRSLAEKMNISSSTLSDKVNEKTGNGFTQPEILFIKKIYNLTAEQIDMIFCTPDMGGNSVVKVHCVCIAT